MGLTTSSLGCGRQSSTPPAKKGNGGVTRKQPNTKNGVVRRKSSSFREPFLSLVKDVHLFVNTSDATFIRNQVGNHFTVASRRERKEFAYGGKNRRRSLEVGIDCGDFDQYQLVGKGGFGAVFKARRKTTGKCYALKVQPMESMARSSRSGVKKIQDETLLHMERTVLASCRNYPFIVSLEYAFRTECYAVLAMEYVDGGTLSHLIASSPGMLLPFDLAKTYTMEIALGLNFMHRRGIIYRDLKPSNILINRHGHLKLTDFGLSASLVKHKKGVETPDDCDGSGLPPLSPALPATASLAQKDEPTGSTDDLSESSDGPEISNQEETLNRWSDVDDDVRWVRRRTVCGTAGYRPPEQVQERYVDYASRNGYDERADWFALGVCCYTMVTGRRPFPTKKELQKSERSMRVSSRVDSGEETTRIGNLCKEASRKVLNDAEFRCLMFEVPYPVHFSFEPEAQSFIKALLARDPKERLRFDGIVSHPWMEGEKFDEASVLRRPIQQWVKDHAYLQSVQVTRKHTRNSRNPWRRYLTPPARTNCAHALSDRINEMCQDCFETHDNAYAKYFAHKWMARPSEKTVDLFTNWNFISEDAIQLEVEAVPNRQD